MRKTFSLDRFQDEYKKAYSDELERWAFGALKECIDEINRLNNIVIELVKEPPPDMSYEEFKKWKKGQ